MKIFYTTLIFLLGCCNSMHAQLGSTTKYLPSFVEKQNIPESKRQASFQKKNIKQLLLHPELSAPITTNSQVPLVFCANTLPFFCKIEHRIEKQGGFPMKFRLGEVQQVETKEGKR